MMMGFEFGALLALALALGFTLGASLGKVASKYPSEEEMIQRIIQARLGRKNREDAESGLDAEIDAAVQKLAAR